MLRSARSRGGQSLGAAFDRFCTPVQLERRKASAGKFARIALDLPFGRLTGIAGGPEDGPPVLLVHGWNSQAEFFQPLLSACVRQGLRVYAFDMPAHGQTREANPHKPASTLVEWVETLIDASRALNVAGWKCIIAHSFGGLAAGYALGARPWAGQPPTKAQSLVLLAGAAGMPTVIDSYARSTGAPESDIEDIRAGVVAACHVPLPQITVAAVADALPPRILVMHDPADDVARLADLKAVLAAHPPSEEILRPGAGHDGILFQLDVFRAVSKFASA